MRVRPLRRVPISIFPITRTKRTSEPAFGQCGYRPQGPAIAGPNLFWCDARAVFRAIVQRSPIGTPTVVLRRSKVGGTRFVPWLRSAGEDSIFWLTLVSRDLRAACSVKSEVTCGRGVSIFNHRSWGDRRALATTLDEMRLQIYLRSHFPLEGDLVAQSRAQCRRLDLAFCANLIACGRRLQWSAAGPAWAYIRRRPWVLLEASPRLPGGRPAAPGRQQAVTRDHEAVSALKRAATWGPFRFRIQRAERLRLSRQPSS